MSVYLILLPLVVDVASLFAAAKGWQALRRAPHLRGRDRLRDAPPWTIVFLGLCLAGGLAGGWLLGKRVDEGREEQRESREAER